MAGMSGGVDTFVVLPTPNTVSQPAEDSRSSIQRTGLCFLGGMTARGRGDVQVPVPLRGAEDISRTHVVISHYWL
jgi:hypothetical protein